MLSIRVYRINANGQRREVSKATVTAGEKPDFMSLGLTFPPCTCPRCRPRTQ